MRTIVIFLAGAAGLAACSPPCGPDCGQFYQEAGGNLGGSTFGNATLNNHLAVTGQQQYRMDLAQRFATEVDSTVTFATNSAHLDAEAQATLRRQAHWIAQFPEVRFRVYGHTDAVGPAAYNKALGQRRAEAVVAYLSRHGISRARLEAVASFGEHRPLIPTHGPERRNRRTVTEVSGFVQSHPMVLDGKYAQIVYRDYVSSAVPITQLTNPTGGGPVASPVP